MKFEVRVVYECILNDGVKFYKSDNGTIWGKRAKKSPFGNYNSKCNTQFQKFLYPIAIINKNM